MLESQRKLHVLCKSRNAVLRASLQDADSTSTLTLQQQKSLGAAAAAGKKIAAYNEQRLRGGSQHVLLYDLHCKLGGVEGEGRGAANSLAGI